MNLDMNTGEVRRHLYLFTNNAFTLVAEPPADWDGMEPCDWLNKHQVNIEFTETRAGFKAAYRFARVLLPFASNLAALEECVTVLVKRKAAFPCNVTVSPGKVITWH